MPGCFMVMMVRQPLLFQEEQEAPRNLYPRWWCAYTLYNQSIYHNRPPSGYHYVAVTVTGPMHSSNTQVDVPLRAPYGSTVVTTPSHCYQWFGDGTATITPRISPPTHLELTGYREMPSFILSQEIHLPLQGLEEVRLTWMYSSAVCYVRVPLTIAYETMAVNAVVTPVTCTGANDGTATINHFRAQRTNTRLLPAQLWRAEYTLYYQSIYHNRPYPGTHGNRHLCNNL